MASRSRNFGLTSLLIISSAVALSVSCSSANKKKAVDYPGDGGAAGDAGSAGARVVTGGAGARGSEAGAAGVRVEAGAGGVGGVQVTPDAGAGGVFGEGGSAGAAQATACEQSGSLTNASFNLLGTPVVCRGTSVPKFFSGNAPNDFSCCAAFRSVPASAFAISGTTNHDGGVDAGGAIHITVPADAPLGTQILDVSCPNSDGVSLSPTLNIVTPAVVTGIDASVQAGGTLTITGTGFSEVSIIWLNDGEVPRVCKITSQSATTLICSPQYVGSFWVELAQGDCNPAPNKALKVKVTGTGF